MSGSGNWIMKNRSKEHMALIIAVSKLKKALGIK
jgi:hypothetical protein